MMTIQLLILNKLPFQTKKIVVSSRQPCVRKPKQVELLLDDCKWTLFYSHILNRILFWGIFLKNLTCSFSRLDTHMKTLINFSVTCEMVCLYSLHTICLTTNVCQVIFTGIMIPGSSTRSWSIKNSNPLKPGQIFLYLEVVGIGLSIMIHL